MYKYVPKNEPYKIRDSSFTEQHRCKTTTLDLRTIWYIGIKLWNNSPYE